MATQLAAELRHPKERTWGGMMTFVGTAIWLAIVLGFAFVAAQGYLYHALTLLVPFVLYGFLIWLALVIAAAFYRAYAYGHFVLLTEQQLPALHRAVAEAAAEIGLATVPQTFVYNSNGVINAFARRLLGKPFVFLTSALIDADTDAQVRFVIGHELGHHAAGHLNWAKNLLKLPAHLVPFLPQAYSRGRELTADRVGAYLAHDPAAARGALQMLACGSARLNPALNHGAFAAQEQMVPGFFGWLLAIISSYPRLTKRVLALDVAAARL